MRVLTTRQELTGADRAMGSAVRTEATWCATGGAAKSWASSRRIRARVERVSREQNQITIERKGGQQQHYDPRRLSGVTVYREEQRAFSEGDRVQFTAPIKELHVANRQLGTVEKIDAKAEISESAWTPAARLSSMSASMPHLDYGYAVDQPQQPRADRRPRPDPRRHRTRPASGEQPLRLCIGFAWTL